MFAYIWPLALVVLSNVFYHICEKSVPDKISPFASLTVSYLIGSVISIILYFITSRGGNLLKEVGKLNWTSIVLGVVIVGLEAGWIYAYKAGWQISTASIVQSALLAIALIFVGFFLYKEGLTWNKIVGILLCLAGLVVINLKIK